MHLRPERQGPRELPPHVLDLRQQVEGAQVVGALLEHGCELFLGTVRLADLDEDAREVQALALGRHALYFIGAPRPGIGGKAVAAVTDPC